MDALTLAQVQTNYPQARSLGAPIGSTNCDPLAVVDTPDGRIVSFWKPSEAELAQLVAGQPVALHIFSRLHPPVALSVTGVNYEA